MSKNKGAPHSLKKKSLASGAIRNSGRQYLSSYEKVLGPLTEKTSLPHTERRGRCTHSSLIHIANGSWIPMTEAQHTLGLGQGCQFLPGNTHLGSAVKDRG